jgi:hypothetical protein
MAKARNRKQQMKKAPAERAEFKAARDASYEAKVQSRVLRFFNEARFAEQLMIAPHDRIAIDEETHHTSDHMEHFEHLKPKLLLDRKTAQKIIVARDRARPFRGFDHIKDITALFPGLADILDRFFPASAQRPTGAGTCCLTLRPAGPRSKSSTPLCSAPIR